MAQYYLLTTLTGIFLLDNEFKVVSREGFPPGKQADWSDSWLDAEREMIGNILKKESNSTVTVLGKRKEEPPKGAECSMDTKLRTRAGLAIEQSPKAREVLRQANLKMTRLSIKESFSEEQLIIHSVRLIEDMNKALSLLGKRFREWIALHQPSLARRFPDHERLIKELLEQEEFPSEEMGADIPEEDCEHLRSIARSLTEWYEFREKEGDYLERKMEKHCPNINALTGARIGGKLLSIAGSLRRLALLPSSTIQMLGAEQALFRHLRNPKAKPPKYGVLHEHPLIKISKRSDHGKVARALADKIAVAARVDFFKGEYMGDQLVKKVEKRFGPW